MQSESGNESGAIVPANADVATDVVARPAVALPAAARAAGGGPRSAARRAPILIVAGAAAFAIAYALAPHEQDGAAVEVREPATTRPAPASRAKHPPAVLTAPNRAEVDLQAAADPFIAVSFVPPPPPPPPAASPPPPPPPPPPKAPPLPFLFVGLLEKGGPKPTAFLARGSALLVVSTGDVVDNDYRIESLSAREIVVTYLPLNERQSLTATGDRP